MTAGGETGSGEHLSCIHQPAAIQVKVRTEAGERKF